MRDLTSGNEGMQVVSFTMPMIIGNLLQQSYQVVNGVIVGQFLGKESIAAIGASFPVIFLLIAMVVGIGNGGTVIIAQFFGAKDTGGVNKVVDTMNMFMLLSAVIVSAVGIVFARNIYEAINIPDEVINQATSYLQIYLLGMVGLFGFYSSSAILRGMGDSRTPLYFQAASIFLNAVLDVLFIGVFRWGIGSVAFATIISQTLAFAATVVYINRTHQVVKFRLFDLKWDTSIFAKCLKIGLPSGLQQTFVSMGMMALLWIVGAYGTDTLAAYSIASRIDMFATIPAMTFSYGISTFVGQNIGAGRWDRVSRGVRSTLLITSVMSLVLSAVIFTFSKQIIGMFSSDAEVISIGGDYLTIVCSFYVLFSVFFLINGALRGAGDTVFSMFVTLFILWGVRIPMSMYLSQHHGVTGIWVGIPVSWFIGMALVLAWYKYGRWRKSLVATKNIDASAEVIE